MTRSPRTVRPGAWYHVTHRGAGDAVLFPTARRKDAFLAALGRAALRFSVDVHAYCVMESHYHLLARAEEERLRRMVRELEARMAARAAEPRFRRMAVGRHLLQVTRYIHLNPVSAGLVGSPGEWAWSSYRGYVDPFEAPSWLRSKSVLGWLGSIGARQRYRRFVEGGRLGCILFPRAARCPSRERI